MRAIALQIAPSPVGGHTHVLHCACGATREAPVGLSIVSCVTCGAAMGQAVDVAFSRPPSRGLLALATFPTQLLGTIAFGLALVWIIRFGRADAAVITTMSLGAACVFLGGWAHRGSIVALLLCAILDAAIATALLTQLSHVVAFIGVPLASVSSQHLELGQIVVGCIAAIAAAECFVATPQARQFADWREDQARRVTDRILLRST